MSFIIFLGVSSNSNNDQYLLNQVGDGVTNAIVFINPAPCTNEPDWDRKLGQTRTDEYSRMTKELREQAN